MQGLHRGRAGAIACALGLIVWSCSSDSRDFGDGVQAGAAGQDGEPPIGGAGGTDAKPDGGAGAETNGGSASDAGNGGAQSQALSVVSTSPDDAATGAERNAAVEVTFSAPIDDASITAESFKVTGPVGAVDGELSVDGATVTFTPSAPWALLADYVVNVSKTVAGTDAGALGAAYKFGFQSRDGVFRKPERLTATAAYLSGVQGNRAGHVVVSWTDKLTVQSSFAVLFDPATGKWGAATAQEADTTNSFGSVSASVNEAGQALVLSGGFAVGSWKRAMGGVWSAAKATGLAQGRRCQLGDAGSAMTMWEDTVGNEWRVFAAGLSADDKWSATVTLGTKARTWSLARFGAGYLALFSHEPTSQVFSRVSDGAGVWAPEQPVTPTGVGANYISLDTSGSSALFTWNDPEGRVQASLFDGASWTSEDLGPVVGGTYARVGDVNHVAAWLNQKSAYAALYDLETGWGAPVKLGPTNAEDFGPAAEVDPSGNALAAWPDGTDITWRRSAHSAPDWSEPSQIKDQDPYLLVSASDASGNVVLVWTNPLGLWATRFE